jgi:hypothetical protein
LVITGNIPRWDICPVSSCQVTNHLAAGVGSFGYEPTVGLFFGVPRSIKVGGAALNIPIVNTVGYDGADANGKRNFTTELGVLASTLSAALASGKTVITHTDDQRSWLDGCRLCHLGS